MELKSSHDTKSFLSNDYRSQGRAFSQENIAKRRAQEEDFLNQEVDYRNFVFAPEGYEAPIMAIYIALIPYLMGLAFLFLFIARTRYESFLEFKLSSFFIIWAIGYEVTAALLIIVIFLAWLNHFRRRHSQEQTRIKGNARKY